MEHAWEVVPVIVIFFVIAMIVKWYLEYRIRKTLIEKGMVDEKAKYLNLVNGNGYSGRSSLKWGLVLTLIGLVMVIMKAMPFYVEDEVILGVMFIAAGGGLLIFYIIDDIYRRRQKRELPGV